MTLPTPLNARGPIQRRTVLRAAAAAAATAFPMSGALAQGAQLETARLITGFAAGGTSDTLCRRLAARMTGTYAKSVIVENRTGAGGQIAIQAMKSLPADGTAILQTPMSMLGIYPHIYKRLAYDPLKDVTPVSLGAVFEFGFAVGPSVPASIDSIPRYLGWVQATRNSSYGSPAAGSVPHFIGVLLGRSAGLDLTHIPYRGTQPAIQDMMGGQVPAVCGPIGDFLPHLAGGRCRLLGTSGPARSRFTPGVATFTEQGMKNMAFSEWFGLFMPGGASPEAVQRANAALRPALASTEVVEGLAAMGLQAMSSTPAELAARLKSDLDRWAPIVKSIGFTAES